MMIRFLRSFRRWDKGDTVQVAGPGVNVTGPYVSGGVADLWVRNRKIAEYVPDSGVQTMVPAVPGLRQIAKAITGKNRYRITS